MFKPLSTAYSTALTNHLHQAGGLTGLKKGEFLPLFWQAWTTSFTPELINKAFETTGISPLNADIILKRFTQNDEGESCTHYEPRSRYYHKLLDDIVKDPYGKGAEKGVKALHRHLYQIESKRDLVSFDKQGLEAALHRKRRYKHKGKALDLQQRREYESKPMWWSPSSVKVAKEKEKAKEEEERQEQLKKVEIKQLRENNKLIKQKLAEAAREKRAKEREEREKVKAEKAAEQARKKEARDAEKALKLS